MCCIMLKTFEINEKNKRDFDSVTSAIFNHLLQIFAHCDARFNTSALVFSLVNIGGDCFVYFFVINFFFFALPVNHRSISLLKNDTLVSKISNLLPLWCD